MIQLVTSNLYPAEVYPQISLIFIRSSTILHLVHRMFTFDEEKQCEARPECNDTHIPSGSRTRTHTTKPSATSSARSRTSSPKRTSASGVLSGGTTWIRLKFANGSTPPAFIAAMTSFISGELPP